MFELANKYEAFFITETGETILMERTVSDIIEIRTFSYPFINNNFSASKEKMNITTITNMLSCRLIHFSLFNMV